MAKGGKSFGRGQQMGGMGMPNTHADEMNSFAGFNTISRGLSNLAEDFTRIRRLGKDVAGIYTTHRNVSAYNEYNRFTGGLQGIIGSLGGKIGSQLNTAILTSLKNIDLKGKHTIAGADLSKEIASLRQEIGKIASGANGLQANILNEFGRRLDDAVKTSARGGFNSIGVGARDAKRSMLDFKGFANVDDAIKSVSAKINAAAGKIGDASLQKAVRDVCANMLTAANAARTLSEKQAVLATAESKLISMRRGHTVGERAIIDALIKDVHSRGEKLKENLTAQKAQFKSGELTHKVEGLTRAFGSSMQLLRPLKRTLDLGNQIFQNFNSKFNQFARMQMRIASERGSYGRQLRGAGIDYGHMLTAIGAGRRAGMDDRTVVSQMVDLQTQLAQARWGEGDLIKKAGRWGISTFDANGDVKEAHQMMIEFSRTLNKLSSRSEKLQFLTHIGRRPEEMEYIANYEKESKRMEFLKKNPHLQGVLDKANIFDAEGWRAKADAYTRIELKRRQILNDNAIEEGLIPGLKRMINPENWFFSDWTARQKGVNQAKNERAIDRLTQVINARIAQEKDKGQKGQLGLLSGLSLEDLSFIGAAARAEKAANGENSAAAIIDKAYTEQFGIKFDVRTPIEKLQGALEPLTESIANGVEWIVDHLDKITKPVASTTNVIAKHPIVSAIAALVGYKFLKGGLGKIGGAIEGVGARAVSWPFEKLGGLFGIGSKTAAKGVSGIGGVAEAASSGLANTAAAVETTGSITKTVASGTASSVKETVAGLNKALDLGLDLSKESKLTPVLTGIDKNIVADATRLHLNNKMGLGLINKGGSKVEEAIADVLSKNPSITRAQAIEALANGGGRGGVGAVSKVLGKVGLATKAVGWIGGALEVGDVAYSSFFKDKSTYNPKQEIRDAIKASFVTAGAGAGSAAGPLGTLSGAGVGSLFDAIFGGMITDSIYEDIVDKAESEGSLAYAKRHGTTWRGDVIENDPEKIGKNFLNGLREALKTNNTQRAMDLLRSNGIHGLDVEALKNDKDFMTKDRKANEILDNARYAQALAQYTYMTGQPVGMEEFGRAMMSDKYLAAARNLGVHISSNEATYAAMRGAGIQNGSGPGFQIMNAYVKNGWKVNKDAILAKEAEIRSENPELSASEVKKQAEAEAKKEYLKNLTKEDMKNYANSLQEQGSLISEHASLVAEAAKYGIDKSGRMRNEKGELYDTEGFLVDANGARVDRKGRHEGDKGFKAVRVDTGLVGIHAQEAYNRLQNFREEYKDADSMTLNARQVEQWQRIASSPEVAQRVALKNLSKEGMDVKNRGFNQMFDEEQIAAVEKAVLDSTDDMSEAGRVAEFAARTGQSINSVRNLLLKSKRLNLYKGAKEEAMKGSDAKNREKAEAAEQKRDTKIEKERQLAEKATDADIDSALKEKGERELYQKLQDKAKDGGKLEDWERTSLNTMRGKIASAMRRKQKGKGTSFGSEYKPTKEEQADIDAALKSGREASASYEKNRRMRPLAETSDIRRIHDLVQNGGFSKKDIIRNFGKDRYNAYMNAHKDGSLEEMISGTPFGKGKKGKRRKPAMSRDEYEKDVRAQIEGEVGKEAIALKRAELEADENAVFYDTSDEGIRKRIVDERVAQRMENYDLVYGKKKGKKGKKGGTEGTSTQSGFPTEETIDKMAQTSAAAESAAASGNKEKSGGGGVQKDIKVDVAELKAVNNFYADKVDQQVAQTGVTTGMEAISSMLASEVARVTDIA